MVQRCPAGPSHPFGTHMDPHTDKTRSFRATLQWRCFRSLHVKGIAGYPFCRSFPLLLLFTILQWNHLESLVIEDSGSLSAAASLTQSYTLIIAHS
eukprot:2471726-Amphidinium_carterae.1